MMPAAISNVAPHVSMLMLAWVPPGWTAETSTLISNHELDSWLNAVAKLLTGFKTSKNIKPLPPPLT